MSRQTISHVLLITAVAATLFFTSLGKAKLWDRDEPRNAGCAAEMLQRGDWIVPIFNDELRHQKPVLLYWLMIAAYSMLGVNEFAARIPSALLAVGTVFLTYGMGRRLFDSSVGLLSAIALSSSIMFCVAARAATPDSVLIFFSSLGIYFYVIGTFANNDDGLALKTEGHWFPQNFVFVILMNVAFGLAVLAKGPVGLVLPTAIIGMFLLIQRVAPLPSENAHCEGRLSRSIQMMLRVIHPIHFLKTCWYMRPITAIAAVLAIAAPWYIAVGIQTQGDFTKLFFLTENLARATTVMENHNGSWLYYPTTIAIGFFPWSIFLGPVLFLIDHQVSQRTKHAPAVTFLACWVAVQVGLFSIAETKLPSYVTPCYPALAILTAFCLLKWIPTVDVRGIRWQFAALSAFVLAGGVTSIGLAVASRQFFPEIWWIAALGLIPVIGGGIAIYQLYRQQPQHTLYSTATSAVLFCLFMFGIGTVAVDSTRQTEIVLNDVKQNAIDAPVATYHCLESSWVFYAERPIFELHRGERSPETPTSLSRKAYWKKKPVIPPEDFVATAPNAIFITTDEHAEELVGRLPAGFAITKETDFFLQEGRKLVLISNGNQEKKRTAYRSKSTVR